MTAPSSSRRRIAGVLAAFALAVVPVTLMTAAPAAAAPTVTVSSQHGIARVSLDGPTTISVSGSGFQSVQGGFGGIYVMFGWVESPSGGTWRPSNGGVTGVNYLYVPDTEARDNAGYQRFVTFPGSSTADAANGGVLATDGTWSLEMVVPGPVFNAQDRNGNTQQVDCTEVTCGVITIGAHGVINPNNESFTPLTFVDPSASGGSSQSGSGSSTGASASQDDTASDDDAVMAADGPATLAVDQSTIIAGRVLGFTARGFAPGEQVMVGIGAGAAGAGPLVAGQFGEVAGAITLPADMRAGSHVLRLEGAGSGKVAEATVAVMADPSAMAPAEPEGSAMWSWAFIVLVVVAALLAAVIISSLVTAIVRRRRARAEALLAEDMDADGGADEPHDTGAIDDTLVIPAASGPAPEPVHGAPVPARASVLGGDGGARQPVHGGSAGAR